MTQEMAEEFLWIPKIGFVLGLILALVFGVGSMIWIGQMENWPQTTGTVTKVQHHDNERGVYSVDITLTYRVQGEDFSTTRHFSTSGAREAEKIATESHRVGQQLALFYSDDHRYEGGYLQIEIDSLWMDGLIRLGMGLMFMLACTILLLFYKSGVVKK
ncbi:DUF3592 domain-containing protein [Magnetococcales bacterium HHB-1]